jgi:hypothetical protein
MKTSRPLAVKLPGAGTGLQRYRIRTHPSQTRPHETVRRQVVSFIGLESENIPTRYRLTSLIVGGTQRYAGPEVAGVHVGSIP